MNLFLGLLGRKGIFLIFDDHKQILAELTFSDADQNHLSAKMAAAFAEALKMSQRGSKDLKKLYCLSGPASFTGLRMSASFMQGLSLGLKSQIIGIPTALLLKSKAALPLRHVLAEKFLPSEYFEKAYQALILDPKSPSGPFEDLAEFRDDLSYIGFKDSDDILERENIINALSKLADSTEEFKIIYGLTPKVGGIRI